MARPMLSRKEYETIIAALSLVQHARDSDRSSMLERRAAHALLPNVGYHTGIIDKLEANTEGG